MEQRAEKDQYLEVIEQRLLSHEAIIFAYVHGSFARGEKYNDIDVAVFMEPLPTSSLDYELGLEGDLEAALRKIGAKVPVDVRILNGSPIAFRYQASKSSHFLFSHDESRRVDFEAHSRSLYFDYAYLRDSYLAGVFGHAV